MEFSYQSLFLGKNNSGYQNRNENNIIKHNYYPFSLFTLIKHNNHLPCPLLDGFGTGGDTDLVGRGTSLVNGLDRLLPLESGVLGIFCLD